MSRHQVDVVSNPTGGRSPSSFEQILRALMPDLLAYFGRRVSSAEDAADCLSDTLVVVWQKRSTVAATEEDVRRFAFGVASRVLLAERRGKRRGVDLVRRIAAHYAPSDYVSEPLDADPELARALATLTARDRELVLLVAWEGFGVGEAGEMVGLQPDAARARYSRARAKLRATLSGERS